MPTKITFNGGLYHWEGDLGSWFMSYERSLQIGTVRCIKGELFYVWNGTGKERWWLPVDKAQNTVEAIRLFRNAL